MVIYQCCTNWGFVFVAYFVFGTSWLVGPVSVNTEGWGGGGELLVQNSQVLRHAASNNTVTAGLYY